ncbi:phospholipase A and acyltransferase 2-like [Pecten maximus]|uniref:phospholipase A and acyltransferase 2-like n=1 Tax=Pecten maximus TaxID=6579 RepID=UPI0014582B1E|nr:phospholipase A and acyltransferase 2-like [Pecten maximus]XP_033728750.1 phospholipase A and acyltransferase 2-like [Pecten maximus]
MAASTVPLDTHNATLLNELEIGDMVEFPRGLYSHWGVYIGEGKIVHLSGGDNDGINAFNSGSVFTICGKSFNKAFVRVDDFCRVVLGCKAKKNNGKDRKCTPRQAHEILQIALDMVGEIGYNVLWNNCEHFAAFIRYGRKWSEQADTALVWTVAAGAVAVGGLLLQSVFSGSEEKKEANK